MIYNTINGKFYIGSCTNLSARIARHFYEAQHGDSQLPLYLAFRKYGLDKFAIIILTFCEPDSSICMALEQSALDTYKPEYNILKQAGVSTGFKHSDPWAPAHSVGRKKLLNIFRIYIRVKIIRDMV